MAVIQNIFIISDIHYAGATERQRTDYETRIIPHPLLRRAVRLYRHFIWMRDPFDHNELLDDFLQQAGAADLIVANGDYSCDTAFVGLSDDGSFASARECLMKLRSRSGERLRAVLGDHELGKKSPFGDCGGLRLASWRRAVRDLDLLPFWQWETGRYLLLAVTSTLWALPLFDTEILPEEKSTWDDLRAEHIAQVQQAFAQLKPKQRVILFCHDPSALPYLLREEMVVRKVSQIERTIIGHLHSNLVFQASQWLSGSPRITRLGNFLRRTTSALREARAWRPFRVLLCPAMAGIELRKDGGYYRLRLDCEGSAPAQFHFFPLRRRIPRKEFPLSRV